MSLLTFLGLRQPKSSRRIPLTLADVLHRTLVTGLTGLSIYGIYLGYSVHKHVMIKGKGTCAKTGRDKGTRRDTSFRRGSRTVFGRSGSSCASQTIMIPYAAIEP
ncbi:hypothetical protein JVU11DRAFT_8933 [Chiua virens]|nr:hypothetical protein JVU11DRAFT_8933 [Chiua virens]